VNLETCPPWLLSAAPWKRGGGCGMKKMKKRIDVFPCAGARVN